MKLVEVAVAVICKNQQIFISKRLNHLHQGGKWEFPGGKREAGESIEQALVRELKEEIGIDVITQTPFMLIEHDYGDKQVRLDIRIVEQFTGEPKNREGQTSQWVDIEKLTDYDFPEANTAIVEKLQRTFLNDRC